MVEQCLEPVRSRRGVSPLLVLFSHGDAAYQQAGIDRGIGPMINTTAGWAGVLEDHRAELVRMAESRLRRGADAEDVLHEVLVRVLRSGRGIEAVGAPVAYLRRAVANECVSAWRRSSHDVLVETMPEQLSDSLADVCLDRLSVHRALGVLTERQRRVIKLTVLDDRADHEVALMLGVTAVTVRTTRRRALARLRQELVDPPAPVAA
jgi:RNA polymerase sigma factor (sigma-70 family)